jgi:hypothetical protein
VMIGYCARLEKSNISLRPLTAKPIAHILYSEPLCGYLPFLFDPAPICSLGRSHIQWQHMQATGQINDHTVDCFRYKEVDK